MRKQAVLIGLAGSLLACSPKSAVVHEVAGVVVDSQLHPLAQAVVEVAGQRTQSDSHGAFLVKLPQDSNDAVAVSVTLAGYARVSRPMNAIPKAGQKNYVTLRVADQSTPIVLPAGQESPVTARLQRANGMFVSLTIPADAMVLPTGEAAHGAATVRLTYWTPDDDLVSAPAPLLGTDARGRIVQLHTFGMADIEVDQNGTLLQVAQGKTLSLGMAASPGQRPGLAHVQPNLYSMDPNRSVWQLEGTVADGTLAYQAASATFVAQLRHLSGWNIDNGDDPTTGGCVTGTVVDACDPTKTVPNEAVNIYLYNNEETARYSGKSDASGRYCIDIPYSPYVNSPTAWTPGDLAESPYYMAGANPNASGMCNPAPAYCMN